LRYSVLTLNFVESDAFLHHNTVSDQFFGKTLLKFTIMDGTAVNQHEEKNKKTGAVFSFAVHVGLFILALLPFLTFPDPPPGQEGILVNLGIPDVGQGSENAPIASSEPEVSEPVEETVEAEPEEVAEPEVVEPEPEPEPVEEVAPPVKTEPVKKEVVKTEDPKALALKKKKEKERKEQEERRKADAEKKRKADAKKRADAKKKADAEAKKRAAAAKKKAEADAKKKAEDAAKAKAAADAKKYNDAKNKYGSLFGGGDGEGKGKTGKPGNQGDPGGDPNSNNLEGISTGTGKVGGGLGSRGVLASPRVTDNSQKKGRVVVKVCVDGNGKVISAKFTQSGSTTTDSTLRAKAEKNARSWKFSKGSMDKQCGTITYDFKVK